MRAQKARPSLKLEEGAVMGKVRGRGEEGEREGRGRGEGGVRVEDMGNKTVKMMKANERNKLRKICIKMGRGEEN